MITQALRAWSVVALLVFASSAFAESGVPLPGESEAYSTLSAEWWQWAYLSTNSAGDFITLDDATGEFCDLNQPEADTWFLAGIRSDGPLAGTGPVSRSCAIPAGRRLFFPLLNSLSLCPFPGETPEDLKASAAGGLGLDPDPNAEPPANIELYASINGIPVERRMTRAPKDQKTLFSLRTQSEIFGIDSSVFYNNPVPFGLPVGALRFPVPVAPGSTELIEWACPNYWTGDGYYVLVEPLPPGSHVIEFGASIGSFEVDVTYYLTVASPADAD